MELSSLCHDIRRRWLTKVDRDDRAVDVGRLIQDKRPPNLRVNLLRLTDKLGKRMNKHLVRTLNEARRVLGVHVAQ